jgi:hypothetical protein
MRTKKKRKQQKKQPAREGTAYLDIKSVVVTAKRAE